MSDPYIYREYREAYPEDSIDEEFFWSLFNAHKTFAEVHRGWVTPEQVRTGHHPGEHADTTEGS